MLGAVDGQAVTLCAATKLRASAIPGALGEGNLLASLFANESGSAAQLITILVAIWPCCCTASPFCSCYSIENSDPP